MQNEQIREVRQADDAAWDAVELLFADMYDYMAGKGLMFGLDDGGPGKWISAVKKGLGRFGVLFISSAGGEITGFAYGSIRIAPEYLGNRKVGVITHIHLKPGRRGKGTGRKLVASLEEWFHANQVHSVELQVVSGNTPAMGFWEKLGYRPELVQYRKSGKEL